MHILILTPGFPSLSNSKESDFYGTSFQLAEVMAFHSAGAKVTVLTPHVPGLPVREVIREGLEIIRFRYFFPTKWQMIRIPKHPLYTTKLLLWRIFQLPFFLTAFFLSIFRFIEKIDIIHAQWTPTALIALPFKFFFKMPIILTFRGSDIQLVPKFINQYIFRNVTAFTYFQDQVGKGRYSKSFPGYGIRLPFITRTADKSLAQIKNEKKNSNIQFVFIGRLFLQDIGELKGVDIIIPASKKLREQYDNFEVNIIGDGPTRELIERQHREYGVENYVRLHGYQDDIFPYVLNSNAVIGGLGVNAVAQESAYCKALLIMPDVSEWTGDIWTHKDNCILYKPKDSESLAEAMAYVIDHPEKCKEIAVNGYNTIRKYVRGIEEGGKIYIDAFRKIIEESKR